jgi:hypothetical protein
LTRTVVELILRAVLPGRFLLVPPQFASLIVPARLVIETARRLAFEVTNVGFAE